MIPLVTLEDAKAHLKVTDTAHDAEITGKIAQASDFIVGYLDTNADPAWTPATVPPRVTAAILLYLTLIYVHRDDWVAHGIEEGTFTGIANLLRADRQPVIA